MTINDGSPSECGPWSCKRLACESVALIALMCIVELDFLTLPRSDFLVILVPVRNVRATGRISVASIAERNSIWCLSRSGLGEADTRALDLLTLDSRLPRQFDPVVVALDLYGCQMHSSDASTGSTGASV